MISYKHLTESKPKRHPNAEVIYWQTIAKERDPELYRAYLEQFPDGTFANLARLMILRTQGPRIKAQRILQAVSDLSGVSIVDLKSQRRCRHMVRPRQVCMTLLAELTTMSLPQIGAFLGGRDHTTVIHARRVIDGLTADGREPATRKLADDVRALMLKEAA